MMTQERLKELLSYNPDTGVFIWITKPTKKSHPNIGDIAGAISDKGYRRTMINKKLYLNHRLAWLYMTGHFPKNEIDHIDGNRLNNIFTNLRECTKAENSQNQISHKNSSSKYLGVSWYKNTSKWRAQIRKDGKKKNLGYYETENEAYKAYCKAKSDFHKFNPIPR